MSFRFTRLAVLVVGLSVAAGGCGKYSISNIRSLKAFQDANNLYKKADYKAAVVRYEDAIRFNPDLGFAYFFLGNSYDNLYKPARKGEVENDGYLQKAADNYRLAIDKLAAATDPKEQEIRRYAYEYLIMAYGPEKLSDFTRAEPIATELIAANPDEPTFYQSLGKLYEDQGRFEEAEAQYLKAVQLRPSDALVYQVLAGFYNRQGDFEKTMDAWQQRANAEPNNPEAWHTIGVYYQDKVYQHKTLTRDLGLKYTLAGIAAEDKALALNSEYFEALSYKNILLRQQALYERDPAVQKRLITEADVLRERALELQKKQNLGGAAAEAAKKGGK